ncbi:1-(5-phosphoribosyl)-5-((5-phosphoribosylamino)methylideneamino)imidazole-4-carboxamide isomerase [Sulfuracidifex metallicus]|uniref:1-(5-phosphoribosyl)-5-[(5-phosphoribosylamino)methylideneamino] imidazole-4-carboxamide isomerase n=1 Tax=Sulfuracidifex metallicus DSM 6482 = JCM 9184 TaxID=523847 RepID=A0A6A9QIU5_SULME|nr:1-(5-phosphoribosyl)-5-((5-phosphoribosylamino)methylideneamino)imidazole-4-carboxamide isomerase [Sulfuracidifex metallicus]MUN28140.1 1-(5-phosphoribosyl)-5-((5-phosphoribosylamino)methylideneamino)imidazole-4-carboxamide isomerase [Sulfuracidifex metallicus DSM 6482 = JCM 9184]WOE51321.1 1-(5-phosphoribosyl)-5-((5-phosphoribosylamino)methylideneamino)imidazole-4-carboxamide isomerase [Sulfuracidifex metallicus DSM 6482 = JCM 9184]
MKVLPSIDISDGVAVKRIKGKSNSGIKLGNPVDIAKEIIELGYDSVHVVDLDAAEGKDRNLEYIREICKLGFSFVQVGGGIREIDDASKILEAGASAIIMSTLPFMDENKFLKIVDSIGKDKVLVSVDYNSSGEILIKGWSTSSGFSISRAISNLNNFGIKGIILTFVENEGTKGGIDKHVGDYVKSLNGIKEYAGGISSMEDLLFLSKVGIDYAIIGMAFYSGSLRGVRYV